MIIYERKEGEVERITIISEPHQNEKKRDITTVEITSKNIRKNIDEIIKSMYVLKSQKEQSKKKHRGGRLGLILAVMGIVLTIIFGFISML